MKKLPRLVPSTVSAPQLVHASCSTRSEAPRSEETHTQATVASVLEDDDAGACPIATRLLRELRVGIDQLPDAVPEGQDGDALAVFSGDPEAYTTPEATSDEVWEQTLHPLLTNALGWKKTMEEAAQLVRRGEKGVEGLWRFLNYFVSRRGLQGGLLEGKLRVLIDAINSM